MALGTSLLIIIGACLIIGLMVWLLILYFRTQDKKTKQSLIVNLMPQYAKGHALGQEVRIEKSDNRFLVEYSPRDVSDELLLEKGEIENVKVVVDKDKIITLPCGTLSAYRDIKFLLAPHAEDYSTELKSTLLGKHLMEMTEEINNNNLETSIVREGSNRKTKMAKNMGDGEVSQTQIEKFEELAKEMIKIATQDKGQGNKPSSGFHPPGM